MSHIKKAAMNHQKSPLRPQKPLFLMLFVILCGCVQEIYSECPSQRESLKVIFKPKASSVTNSHSFCIVCDPSLAEGEYESWALEMGAPQGPQDPSSVHPCLYAYSTTEIETMQQCEQLICNHEATYNDMVGKNNGNFDLGPILH